MPSSNELHNPGAVADGARKSLFKAMVALHQAGQTARREGRKTGCPFLSLAQLRKLGLNAITLPWLMFHGLVEHVQFDPKKPKTKPKPVQSMFPVRDSHVALTAKGVEYAEELRRDPGLLESEPLDNKGFAAPRLLVPHYDKDRRVFCWGCHVLKDFHQPAKNQELILCAAEELEWPDFFDDPLPPIPGKKCKKRLHYTIQDLNRRQRPYLIHFKGDGSGTRIGWELR